jgi:hypothetical protein
MLKLGSGFYLIREKVRPHRTSLEGSILKRHYAGTLSLLTDSLLKFIKD